MQSYYECFLQIEKENNSLKSKIEQMRGKLQEQQEKIDSLLTGNNLSNININSQTLCETSKGKSLNYKFIF